ncbi:phage tail tip lysozyme [Burkholderia cepacia]|uniref:phage tail tip lysozyme n=1 Tax=Burkholderia cepacia TaxID=292 RepID=UPI000751E850|nr:phage tail tip lysozyme [Burkholderia cepacia]KWH52570.1 phage tail protein [Burkholderia cepacia]
MASKISISIVGNDQASGPIGKVTNSLSKLQAQARKGGISNLGRSISAGLSSNSGALSEIASFVGKAGIIGGVTALTMKIAQMESQWASSVRSMNNLGIRTGLPTTTAYGVQYAGRLAGLSPEQANAGIEQVRQTYSDAVNNRNPEALKRFQYAGISTSPYRMESIESVLTKLSAYSEALRKQGKYGGAQNFLNAAGAGSLVDFLNRGPGQVAADLQAAKAYVPTEQDIQRAREYADASAKLGITYDRLKTTVLGSLEPALNSILNGIQFFFDATSGRGRPQAQPNGSDSTEQRIWDGFEKFGNSLRGRGPYTMAQLNTKTSVGNGAQLEQARSMVEWYVNHGLSRERAIGMVANASRESGLDERAVGDNGKAVGLYQWHPDRQALYEKTFGRPLALASREEQMGFSLWELQNNERAAGRALMASTTSEDSASTISRLYERPKDPGEADIRAGIARGLDSELSKAIPPLYERAPVGNQGDPDAARGDEQGSAAASAGSDPGKVRIEIVHKNPPSGTSATVTSSPNVETEMRTDRQQAPLGDQYAYSPGNF